MIFYLADLRNINQDPKIYFETHLPPTRFCKLEVPALDLGRGPMKRSTDPRWPNMPQEALNRYTLEELARRCSAIFIKLKYAHLSMNQIGLKWVPLDLTPIRNVKTLDLGENFLSDLPLGFEELKNLRFIYLQSNQFRAIPL